MQSWSEAPARRYFISRLSFTDDKWSSVNLLRDQRLA